jgi:hypothetical protein
MSKKVDSSPFEAGPNGPVTTKDEEEFQDTEHTNYAIEADKDGLSKTAGQDGREFCRETRAEWLAPPMPDQVDHRDYRLMQCKYEALIEQLHADYTYKLEVQELKLEKAHREEMDKLNSNFSKVKTELKNKLHAAELQLALLGIVPTDKKQLINVKEQQQQEEQLQEEQQQEEQQQPQPHENKHVPVTPNSGEPRWVQAEHIEHPLDRKVVRHELKTSKEYLSNISEDQWTEVPRIISTIEQLYNDYKIEGDYPKAAHYNAQFMNAIVKGVISSTVAESFGAQPKMSGHEKLEKIRVGLSRQAPSIAHDLTRSITTSTSRPTTIAELRAKCQEMINARDAINMLKLHTYVDINVPTDRDLIAIIDTLLAKSRTRLGAIYRKLQLFLRPIGARRSVDFEDFRDELLAGLAELESREDEQDTIAHSHRIDSNGDRNNPMEQWGHGRHWRRHGEGVTGQQQGRQDRHDGTSGEQQGTQDRTDAENVNAENNPATDNAQEPKNSSKSSALRCYNCGDYRHLIGQCPHPCERCQEADCPKGRRCSKSNWDSNG